MPATSFEITSARTPGDVADVAALMRDYAASLPVDLGYQGFDRELAELPGAYAPPTGALLIARDGAGKRLGCVGLRAQPDTPGCCEMKRLYVAPHARGLGLGRALMQAAIEKAARLGYRTMRLDTLPTMTSAIAMYQSSGFRPIAPYYSPAPPGTVFMAKDVARGPAPSLRRARPADLSDAVRIWHEGWNDAHIGNVPDGLLPYRHLEHFEALARTRLDGMWIAEVEGDIAGFTVIKGDEVEQLYVDRRHRGAGVAVHLLAHGENEIRRAGHRVAWLAVVGGNSRGRAFYARSGWRDAGTMSYEAQTADGTFPVPTHRYERDLTEQPREPHEC